MRQSRWVSFVSTRTTERPPPGAGVGEYSLSADWRTGAMRRVCRSSRWMSAFPFAIDVKKSVRPSGENAGWLS